MTKSMFLTKNVNPGFWQAGGAAASLKKDTLENIKYQLT